MENYSSCEHLLFNFALRPYQDPIQLLLLEVTSCTLFNRALGSLVQQAPRSCLRLSKLFLSAFISSSACISLSAAAFFPWPHDSDLLAIERGIIPNGYSAVGLHLGQTEYSSMATISSMPRAASLIFSARQSMVYAALRGGRRRPTTPRT
jgi:hypothetical protein